jgi:tyrosyl-tRNA synthetase
LGIYEDLFARGLIAQVTNEKKVKEMLNNERCVFYIGFEPTANSLHVGHFVQILIMSRLQKAGHIPIILFGGGTGMIGDPSGKTDVRKMLSEEEINYNIECFKKQASKFIDFSEGKAIMLNNSDWLCKLNYIEFLRDVGVHFSVNKMLAAECYKQRLEKGLTFFEMNYMVMQSYDFLILNRKYNCKLELGGDDQWSNIIGGIELVRRKDAKEVYGLTFVLLTTSQGTKMGKTEKGALWLDPGKTTPYEFYQYWRNTDDKDVIKCFKILTFLPLEQIKEYEEKPKSDINKLKEILAFELTKLVHGEKHAVAAQEEAKRIFSEGEILSENLILKLKKEDLNGNKIDLVSLLVKLEMSPSKSESRRLIKQGGISINKEKTSDENLELSSKELSKGLIIKKGKKIYKKVILE